MSDSLNTTNFSTLSDFLSSSRLFAKLKAGENDNKLIITTCERIINIISKQLDLIESDREKAEINNTIIANIDDLLIIFLNYLSETKSNCEIVKEILFCIYYLFNLHMSYMNCVIKMGILGPIVDLLSFKHIVNNEINLTKTIIPHNNKILISNYKEIDIIYLIFVIIKKLLKYNTKCNLVFRLHLGIRYMYQIFNIIKYSNNKIMINLCLQISYDCLINSKHSFLQIYNCGVLKYCINMLTPISEIISNRLNSIDKSLLNVSCMILKILCHHENENEFKGAIMNHIATIDTLNLVINLLKKSFLTNKNFSTLISVLKEICLKPQICKNIVRNRYIESIYKSLKKFIDVNNNTTNDIIDSCCGIFDKILINVYNDKIEFNIKCIHQFGKVNTNLVLPSSPSNVLHSNQIFNVSYPELDKLSKRKSYKPTELENPIHLPKSLITLKKNTIDWESNNNIFLTSPCVKEQHYQAHIQSHSLKLKCMYEQFMTYYGTDTNTNTNTLSIYPRIVYDKHDITFVKSIEDDKNTLIFDSHFESANLHRVIQTGKISYDLLLSSDYNTIHHRQWFNFQIKNMKSNIKYKFSIVNLDKTSSIYNEGNKVCFYSHKRYKLKRITWTRGNCSDVYYYSNIYSTDYQPHYDKMSAVIPIMSPTARKINNKEMKKKQQQQKKKVVLSVPTTSLKKKKSKKSISIQINASSVSTNASITSATSCSSIDALTSEFLRTDRKPNNLYHYTLTFTIKFPYDNDTCYISYFYPFTYTKNQIWLNKITISPLTNHILRRQLLCRTRIGNRVDLLTITNFDSLTNEIKKRPVIIISARVHPGESNSSYVIKGLVDSLLNINDRNSIELRNKFVFKIIPMLNPDGVIHGNHRCSLTGNDLNRMYQHPSCFKYPSIFHLKLLIHEINITRKIFLLLDIHGHSKIKNFVLYGVHPSFDAKLKKKKIVKMEAALKYESIDYILKEHDTQGNILNCIDRYKLFPYLLKLRAPTKFSFVNTKWSFTKQKEGTLRVVFWKNYHLQNCFTLESTYCGSQSSNILFNMNDYIIMGQCLNNALHDMIFNKNKVEYAILALKTMAKTGKTKKKKMKRKK